MTLILLSSLVPKTTNLINSSIQIILLRGVIHWKNVHLYIHYPASESRNRRSEFQEWRGTSGVSIFAIETLCIISDYVLALTSHVGSSREEPTHGWFIRLHRASPGSGRVPTTKGRRKIVAYLVSVFGVAHGAECATRIDHPINFVSLLW